MTKFILSLVVLVFMLLILFKPIYVCFYPFLKGKKHKFALSFLIGALILISSFLIGDIAFGFFIHFVVIFYIIDFITSVINLPFRRNYNIKSKRWFTLLLNILLVSASVIFTAYGYVNFNDIKTTTYNLNYEGKTYPSSKIMFVSDIHISSDKKEHVAYAISKTYKKENPDVCIIGGDLIDNSSRLDDINYIIDVFSKISLDTPVLYVHGNHDIMANEEVSTKELEEKLNKKGIKVLKDENVEISDINYIVVFKESEKIKPLMENGLNVVINHKPEDLKLLDKYSVNLLLSGHTHAGQFFPVGYICDLFKINELQYGLKDFGDFKAIVSSGISTWGVNVKSQGKNEIVIINVN